MHPGGRPSCDADSSGIARIGGARPTGEGRLEMSSFGGGRIDVARPILLDRYTVSYEVSCTSEMRKYFSGRGMFITYDADISIVPNALLLIPVLSTLAPIAWALGADLSAHSIDAGFLRALGDIQQSFRRLHPDASWSGEVFGD